MLVEYVELTASRQVLRLRFRFDLRVVWDFTEPPG